MTPKVFVLIGISALLLYSPAHGAIDNSQAMHVAGSPNPVGSGSRATGMGGAFIGVADDATAASWNPAGLVQLERPEMSLVYSFDFRHDKRSFSQNPGASGEDAVSLDELNYLSVVYPFAVLNRNMVASLNYQTTYDFNKKTNRSYNYSSTSGPNIIVDNALFQITNTLTTAGERTQSHEIDGYLKSISPAFAVRVTPTISVGTTLNWYCNDLNNNWLTSYTDHLTNGTVTNLVSTFNKMTSITTTAPPTVSLIPDTLTPYSDEYALEGINFNLGFFWNINSNLTLGLVYKSALEADIRYTETINYGVSLIEDQTLVMPQSYGLGVSYRFSDNFTMDFDIYRTDWQDFALIEADGSEKSLITGEAKSLSDTQPTHQVRMGGEYLFIGNNFSVPVRAGIFYDPEPTAYSPDDFYGLSCGSGLAYKNYIFDFSYQLRWGNDVRETRLSTEVVGQNIKQHTFNVSMIYHF